MVGITRINFNPSTSTTTHWKIGTGKPAWLEELISEFKLAHNMVLDESYERMLLTEQGIKHIVEWLKEEGYKAEYWEMDFAKPDSTNGPQILAYGLKFENNCEKFVELKLRS